jgi:hypothetical protein
MAQALQYFAALHRGDFMDNPTIGIQLLGHLSYVLLVSAALVRGIMPLRLLAIGSGLASIVYGVAINSQVDIFWESIFTLVNAVQVVILIRERQKVCLSDEEVSLREAVFPHMSRLDFHRFIRAGSWLSHAPGVELASRGQPVDQIVLVSDGTADVTVDGAVVSQCRSGDFIGEIAFMTENPATATVTTASPTRCLTWKFTDLRALLNHHPDLRTDLQTVFNKNLIGKLAEQRDRHAEE